MDYSIPNASKCRDASFLKFPKISFMLLFCAPTNFISTCISLLFSCRVIEMEYKCQFLSTKTEHKLFNDAYCTHVHLLYMYHKSTTWSGIIYNGGEMQINRPQTVLPWKNRNKMTYELRLGLQEGWPKTHWYRSTITHYSRLGNDHREKIFARHLQ